MFDAYTYPIPPSVYPRPSSHSPFNGSPVQHRVQQPHASSSRSTLTSTSMPSPHTPTSNTSSPHMHHSASQHEPSRSASVSASSSTKRPKALKKAHSSSMTKQRGVQASLEAKVEKCRGWNAFFVPLGRSLPAAPPSSPILGAATLPGQSRQTVQGSAYVANQTQRAQRYTPGQGDQEMQVHLESQGEERRNSSDDSDLSRSTSHSSHHPQQYYDLPHPQVVQQHLPSNDYFTGWEKKGEQWVEDVRDMEEMDLDAA